VAEPTSPIVYIYKELFDRIEELKNIDKWLDQRPRLVVAGQPDSAPRQLFEALFGAAETFVETEGWSAAASFKREDVPGLGAIGAQGESEQALTYLRETDVVLLTILVDHRPTDVEQGLFDHLKRLGKVRLLVVTEPAADEAAPAPVSEIDHEAWEEWVHELRRVFGQGDVACLPARGLHSADLVAIARAIHRRDELDAKHKLTFTGMLAHQASRDALVGDVIGKLSQTAMWLGLSPLPFSDVAAITPLQVLLVTRVAACYGQRLTFKEARSFVAASSAVGAVGFGFRELFRAITGSLEEAMLPLKLVVGAGLAWSGTQLVGRAARLYYQKGSHLTPQEAGRRARAELAAEGAPRHPFGGRSPETKENGTA
jgi:uncharacterized protein (DUF697 family)